MKLYFAAPLFSRAERNFNLSMADELRTKGFEVILPQELTNKIPKNSDFFKDIFGACLTGINEADAVVAIVDGPDVDSGTCFEMGYAYAMKKPIFAVRTDPRDLEEKGVNLMVSQSVNHLLKSVEATTSELSIELGQVIKKTVNNQ